VRRSPCQALGGPTLIRLTLTASHKRERNRALQASYRSPYTDNFVSPLWRPASASSPTTRREETTGQAARCRVPMARVQPDRQDAHHGLTMRGWTRCHQPTTCEVCDGKASTNLGFELRWGMIYYDTSRYPERFARRAGAQPFQPDRRNFCQTIRN
jgi:hypothetical protein